jgi:tetratricopeptide (TPR) repeat protein
MSWQRISIVVIVAGGVLFAVGGNAAERRGSYDRAMELLQQGVVFEAIHELELFVTENPDHEAARMELARSLHRVKRDRRTAEEAAHVLRINPENAEARRLLTRIRIKLGRDLDRNDPVAVLDYARLCARPETYDRAADFYRLYLQLDDDPLVHMEFARMLYWAGRYEDAESHLRVYLAYKPDDAGMHHLLGKIYGALGDFEKAVEEYLLCRAARPDDVELQLDLARALMWSGRESEAQKILVEIRRRSSEYDTPLLLLATIARIQGRVEEEYELYKTVLARDPDNAEAKARVKELEKGNRLAIAVCLGRLAAYPEDVETRRKLIGLYLEEERHGEAIPHLRELGALEPSGSDVLNQLRHAREEEGRRALVAVSTFHEQQAARNAAEIVRVEAWVRGNPNDYRSRVRLADLLLESKDYVAAVTHLEILESMTPGDGRVVEKLQRTRLLMKDAAMAETASEE